MKVCFWFPLLLISCGSSDIQLSDPIRPTYAYEKRVCIDSSFDQEDTKDITFSIIRWNSVAYRTGVWMKIDKTNCHLNIDRFNQLSEMEDTCKDSRALACANHIGGDRILVMRNRIESQFKLRGVVLHELGHILGASHTKSGKGLMTLEYSGYGFSFIDQETINAVSTYNKR